MPQATATRAPRGTKVVAQAFFSAANAIPEPQRAAVIKAAFAAIRDELKAIRERAASAKAKTKTALPTKKVVAKPVKRVSLKVAAQTAAPAKTVRATRGGRPLGSKNKPKAKPAPVAIAAE